MTRQPCPLHKAALHHPHVPAVVTASGRETAFAECDAQAMAAAAALRVQGLANGGRIALLNVDNARAIPLLFGAFRAGVTVYLPNMRLPESALREHVHRAGCSHAICGENDYASSRRLDPGALLNHPCDEELTEVDPRAPATIVATSGSTGTPKLVVHALENHLANAAASNANIAVEPCDRWLLSLPLYHVSGLEILFRCILGGGTVAVPDPGGTLEDALEHLRATHISMVAAQLQRLLDSGCDAKKLSRVKAVLLGGSAVPETLIERAVALGVPLHTTYGLTEMASQVTTTPPGAGRHALKTSGKPLTPETLRIAADGEIEVRGPVLFLGYIEEDGTIHRPVTPDGWFRTKDLGYLDKTGNLCVTGRKDNLFVSGGENIQPEEIEAVLCALDAVARAVVVPVTDPVFGHRPAAFIESAPGFALEPDILARQLAERLPRYMIPAAWLPWPEEAAVTGLKPDRSVLRRIAEGKTP